jgi:MFS superfamily sulfate permease-like transporter
LEEIAGAIGDYGTLIPIVLGMAIVSHLDLGNILLFFSAWYIITGLYYRMPVPVEPMKAVGAIVIAGGLSKGEIAASGIVLGILLLALGAFGGMKLIQEKVPHSVVRGIQLGLALILVRTAVGFIAGDPTLGTLCVIIAIVFLVASRLRGIPNASALVILILGITIGIARSGFPGVTVISAPDIVVPTVRDFLRGSWVLALPQAPLTVANAVLATALLMKDLLGRRVSPDTLAKSMGLMNLTSVPFGGVPMCHGAGGLAAQYRFGARTGGSNIISGLLLLPVALFFAGPQFIAIIPLGVFGALLVFTALELGRHGIKTDAPLVTAVVAILALVINITAGFAAGMVLAYSLRTKHQNKTA